MIFIVDDDPSIRTSLTRLMRSVGYVARAFADAEEYLSDADGAAATAGCVILDLHVPGMSGLDLQEIINSRKPPLPVIVLSGSEDAELRAKAVAAGAAKMLSKPCDPKILLRAIEEVLGQSPAPSPPLACPPHLTTGSGELGSERTGLDDPDNFMLEKGRGIYRPAGSVSFDQAVALVRAAIAAAHGHQVRGLLVNTIALTGFLTPDTFERFLMAVEWAEEARGGVHLALVARPEMIHPQKFGVLVAANRGLMSNVFTTEVEARSWLAAWDDQ
jgi:CheY-like chemotaxis protein